MTRKTTQNLKGNFDDAKAVIRNRKSKEDIQYNETGQKGRTMIYRTIHRKLMIEQHEHHQKPEMNSVFRKG